MYLHTAFVAAILVTPAQINKPTLDEALRFFRQQHDYWLDVTVSCGLWVQLPYLRQLKSQSTALLSSHSPTGRRIKVNVAASTEELRRRKCYNFGGSTEY